MARVIIRPMLESKNLILRTVKEADLKELYSYFDSIRLKGEYLSGELLSEHQFQLQFFETGFWGDTGGTLLLAQGDKRVGALWFEKQSFFECLNLQFYIFHPEDRNKGLMKEALPLFCAYLFSTKRVERLQISIPDYSKAALRVAQRSGFQFEGIARSALFHRGRLVDLCIYSLLRSEWIH